MGDDYAVDVFSEQMEMLRILAVAWGTTPEGVARTLITQGLHSQLTNEILEQYFRKIRMRVNCYLVPE